VIDVKGWTIDAQIPVASSPRRLNCPRRHLSFVDP